MKPTKQTDKKTDKPKTAPSGSGVKFTEKYGARLASTYEIDPDDLVIPPKGHALYDPDGNTSFDEIRVQSIDAIGKCVRIVTVWSDPDEGKLFVIAGRGNRFDVSEVNRRRREGLDSKGNPDPNGPREPIKIGFLRFPGTLDEATDFVAMENFRRKRPSPVHVAREIIRYRKLGRDWGRIAELLQLDGEDEKSLRTRIPIAYCCTDVVEAIETKKISIKKAKKFGGGAWDGSKALSKAEQIALLEEMLNKKAAKAASKTKTAAEGVTKPVPRTVQARIAESIVNGHAKTIDPDEKKMARFGNCLIRRLHGEAGALSAWPNLEKIIEAAITEKPEKPEKEKKTEKPTNA